MQFSSASRAPGVLAHEDRPHGGFDDEQAFEKTFLDFFSPFFRDCFAQKRPTAGFEVSRLRWSWRLLLLRPRNVRRQAFEKTFLDFFSWRPLFAPFLTASHRNVRHMHLATLVHCHTVSRAFRCTVLRGSLFVKRNAADNRNDSQEERGSASVTQHVALVVALNPYRETIHWLLTLLMFNL